MKNQSKHTSYIVLSALFAVLIFVVTAYLLHIPTYNGYIHIGDAFIYLAASLLPPPYAAAAGALGAALADGLTGAAVWMVPSILIKSLTALCFTRRAQTILCKRNYLALGGALMLCVGGYYLADGLLFGNFVAPLASMVTNVVQVTASAALYVIFGAALDRLGFKKRSGL